MIPVTIHRFTPPTCTLEIREKNSPLSRWLDRDVLRDFKFKLSFDDPRLPSSQQVTITGDRLNLELLKTAVDGYMQELLHNSFITPTSNEQQQFSNNLPYLQQKSLTECELFFGNLQRDSNEPKISLSTVQLFDLVTALEAYQTKIATLTELETERNKKLIPLWSSIAAVAIAGIGIAAVLYQPLPPSNIASSSKSDAGNSTAEFDDVIPPDISNITERSIPQPQRERAFDSTTRLPPPPAVDTPKPEPNIPNPADYPPSEVLRQSGLKKSPRSEKAEPTPKLPAVETPVATEIIPNAKPETKIETTQEPATINDIAAESDIVKEENNSTQKIPKSGDRAQEIKAYFQKNWQPPEDLKQSLEYRLYLNPNGSISKVVPIGKAANLYLDRTNIPVRGEVFISPNQKSQKSQVRLLLNPDGGVKTFLE